jgi:formamidopyrimidine-DNA glycosylase
MPEGPEIRLAADRIAKVLEGQVVEDVAYAFPELEADELEEPLLSRPFRGRSLASLLLDQSFLAGLGNYLRSEIRFCAGAAVFTVVRNVSVEVAQWIVKPVYSH